MLLTVPATRDSFSRSIALRRSSLSVRRSTSQAEDGPGWSAVRGPRVDRPVVGVIDGAAKLPEAPLVTSVHRVAKPTLMTRTSILTEVQLGRVKMEPATYASLTETRSRPRGRAAWGGVR
jgi:hypothetical protein